MSDTEITDAELQAELERLDVYREKMTTVKHTPGTFYFPENQYKVIVHARTKKPRITWENLMEYFKQNYGYDGNFHNFKRRCIEDIHRHGDAEAVFNYLK